MAYNYYKKRMRDIYFDDLYIRDYETVAETRLDMADRKFTDYLYLYDLRMSDSRTAHWDQASLTRPQPTGTASKASHGSNIKARCLQMSYTEGDYQDIRRLKFPKAPVYPRR